MRRKLAGGVELDDDRSRIDVEAVHEFLSTQAYWALGRPREEVARLVAESQRVVGLYAGGRQIGFTRTVSDGRSIAYLADVYVLPEWRGRGLGRELIRASVDEGPYAGTRWILHTLDRHALYESFGFGPPSERVMERPRPGEAPGEDPDGGPGDRPDRGSGEGPGGGPEPGEGPGLG